MPRATSVVPRGSAAGLVPGLLDMGLDARRMEKFRGKTRARDPQRPRPSLAAARGAIMPTHCGGVNVIGRWFGRGPHARGRDVPEQATAETGRSVVGVEREPDAALVGVVGGPVERVLALEEVGFENLAVHPMGAAVGVEDVQAFDVALVEALDDGDDV